MASGASHDMYFNVIYARSKRVFLCWLGVIFFLATRSVPVLFAAELKPDSQHWSFRRIVRPPFPSVKQSQWPRNGIDYFVLAKLEKENLSPSQEADRTALIRRVTLDLTGLPPIPREVDAFLSDDSPQAFEEVVDRLLASPRFGERMAFLWLDAARYADTSGYQSDGERYMWRWRDWVIDAFNANMPFDEFTIEQIAGDILPNATLAQKIATGFNRNHRGNAEGGIIPEEYAVEYVVDRVDTTCTVWLGMTMGCARCHDHKYDPFTQKEFYQLFAFFNNVPEKGRAVKLGNSPPMMAAPTLREERALAAIDKELAAAESRVRMLEPKIGREQIAWEKAAIADAAKATNSNGELPASDDSGNSASGVWSVGEGLVAHFPLDGILDDKAAHREASGKERTSRKLNGVARWVEGEPLFAPGKIGSSAEFDGRRFIEAGSVGDFGFLDEFTLTAWIFPESENAGAIVSRTPERPEADGYSLCLTNGRIQLNLVKRWLDDALRVETGTDLTVRQWHHVVVSYDGSRVAEGIKIYVDGESAKIKTNLDELNQSFKTSEPFRIGSGGGPLTRFHGKIDEVRIFDRVLDATEAGILATAEGISTILKTPIERRSNWQLLKLREFFLETSAPESVQEPRAEVKKLRKLKTELTKELPNTMVMAEMPTPRDTFILIRGQYDKPGEKVRADVPAILPRIPRDAGRNRLSFAHWLVDASNPLTARVAVNHYWQMYFGTGLVKTAEDFGIRGERPSHPELLDWLAAEFMATGWNVKAMQKLIVMSSAYRQSSKGTPLLLRRDPENRFLARGPRMRLSAEMVRDQALAISGLLVEHLGGPSVKPYQPKGLWKELSGEDYQPDHGENLYRRSLYTFWKRTIPPPTMITFDAAGREACSVGQTRTTTPLQALDLMNDVTFVEAARVLAQRIMTEGGASVNDRVAFGFRLATSRSPSSVELKILQENLLVHLSYYRDHVEEAIRFTSVGETPRLKNIAVEELAAYTSVASLILNLDETISKQ